MRCLLPLPVRRQVPRFEVEIAGAQMNQLGDAHPGGVQHFDQRAVPQAARRRDIGLLDEPLDLFDAEKLRQRRPRPRRLKIVGGICVEVLREHDEADKSLGPRRPCARPSAARALRSSGRRRNCSSRGGPGVEPVFRGRRRILQAVGDRGCSFRACDRPGGVRRAGV